MVTSEIVPKALVVDWPVGVTFASASVVTDTEPTVPSKLGRVATACAFTPTPATAEVAL